MRGGEPCPYDAPMTDMGGVRDVIVLWRSLETVDLDGLGIQLEALLLVDEEFLHILALVSLQLDHLSHLRVDDNRAIAGKLLLDHFEDLLLVEFLGESLDCSQGLASIALCEGISVSGVWRAEGHGRGLRWIRIWM